MGERYTRIYDANRDQICDRISSAPDRSLCRRTKKRPDPTGSERATDQLCRLEQPWNAILGAMRTCGGFVREAGRAAVLNAVAASWMSW
jgi:hypothetical protein